MFGQNMVGQRIDLYFYPSEMFSGQYYEYATIVMPCLFIY